MKVTFFLLLLMPVIILLRIIHTVTSRIIPKVIGSKSVTACPDLGGETFRLLSMRIASHAVELI